MTVKVFVLGALVTALAAGGILVLIVRWLDPASSPWLGLTLFFLTLFLAVAAVTALIGYGLRRILSPGQLPAWRVRPSLRQGIWLGLFLDILLFFQLLRLARWWLTLILIMLFGVIEFVFITYDRGSRYRTTSDAKPAST